MENTRISRSDAGYRIRCGDGLWPLKSDLSAVNSLTPDSMKISVTSSHIEQGERWDAGSCPIALALRAAVVGIDVSVAPTYVAIFDESCDEFLADLPLPPDAIKARQRFDNGHPLAPFTFEMPDLTSDLRSLTSGFTPVPVV